MFSIKKIFFAGLLCSLMLFVSCHGDVTIRVKNNNTADYEISLNIGETAESIIKSVGGHLESDYIDKGPITANLKELGCTDIEVLVNKNKNGSTDIYMKFNAPLKTKAGSLVQYGTNRRNLAVNVSPEKVQGWVKTLPEELMAYVDLLMAPVVEGEIMSEKDYLAAVASVYGDTLAKEIQGGKIKLNIVPPLKNARATTYNVPLPELLTMAALKTYRAHW